MNKLSIFGSETINPDRLVSFSDGIFAIAVTLLAFNLKIPEMNPSNVHAQLPGQIKLMVPHFVTYLISFLLVAIYWTIHHRMIERIAHVDSTFVWLNIGYLLVISFMPFAAGLLGTYPHESICEIIYLGSAALVTILSISMWQYASFKHRLIRKEVTTAMVNYFFSRGAASLAVILFALLLALFDVHGTQFTLFLLIPANITVRRFSKHRA